MALCCAGCAWKKGVCPQQLPPAIISVTAYLGYCNDTISITLRQTGYHGEKGRPFAAQRKIHDGVVVRAAIPPAICKE